MTESKLTGRLPTLRIASEVVAKLEFYAAQHNLYVSEAHRQVLSRALASPIPLAEAKTISPSPTTILCLDGPNSDINEMITSHIRYIEHIFHSTTENENNQQFFIVGVLGKNAGSREEEGLGGSEVGV